MAAPHREVAITIYRALSRVARLYDRDPALKALCTCTAGRVPHDLMKRLAGGVHYRPRETTWRSFVRAEFEATAPADAAAGLDTALAALQHLGECAEFGSALPRWSKPHDGGLHSAWSPAKLHSPWLAGSAWLHSPWPAEGTLLISHPAQISPSFGRSLLLLLSHSTMGSLGVVTNKKSPLTLAQAQWLLQSPERLSSPLTTAQARELLGSPSLGADSTLAIPPALSENRIFVGGPLPSCAAAVSQTLCACVLAPPAHPRPSRSTV